MSGNVIRLTSGQAAGYALPAVQDGFKQEVFAVSADASAPDLFRIITNLGGKNGWYYGNFLWQLRGAIDRFVGGAGMRGAKDRRDEFESGDVLDFWRVEQVVPGRIFLLQSEMKSGGEGSLGLYLFAQGNQTMVIQRALFRPTQWSGRAYWFLLYPIHRLIFRGLLGAIAQRAERRSTAPSS